MRWTGGLATIGAPALMHHADVTTLFEYLAPAHAAALAADGSAVAGCAALLVFIALTICRPAARKRAALEQAILWGAAFLLPPLVFFAVYFCGLHSVRHFDATIRCVPRAAQALATAVVLAAATTLTAAFIFMTRSGGGLSFEDGTMQVVFIGLAALTVPHMLLVERFHRHHPAAHG